MNSIAIPDGYLAPKEYLPHLCRFLPELEYPQRLNLAEEMLDLNLVEHVDKTAIYFETERVSYRELHAKVNKFANALRDLGIQRNDRVILRSLNNPEQIIWNFACWRIGAIPVLVSHLNRAAELAFKINDSEAVAICVDSESYGEVEKALSECPKLQHVVVHGACIPGTLQFEEMIREQSDQAVSADTTKKDIGRIIYSSGTTGKPKAILTTLEGVLSICDTFGRNVLKLRSDDVLGGHPYFSFAFGAGSFLYLPWRFGASVSIISHFSAERQFQLIGEHGITILFGVPTAIRILLGVPGAESRFRLSSLRLIQSAGEPMPVTTLREWKQRFGHVILDSLGSGELHYWLSTFEGMPEEKLGSNGLAVPGYECLIVDEQLNPVPLGTPGELIVRGPLGHLYWRRPHAQASAVCPSDSRFAGWSRPGLYCLQDADGYFWLKSRLDDMIVTSGYKVPGGEVEAVLNRHPIVQESAVIGVPDSERGSIIKAFVVLREGIAPDIQLIPSLQDFVKQELEPYKYPRQIEFIDKGAMPRTATGKVQRKALRDREVACTAKE